MNGGAPLNLLIATGCLFFISKQYMQFPCLLFIKKRNLLSVSFQSK